jgi:hypothetical protein
MLRLVAALIVLPSLASAYGGNFGPHCTAAEKKAGKCKSAVKAPATPLHAGPGSTATFPGSSLSAPPGAPGGAPGGAPSAAPPVADPTAALKGASALKEGTAAAGGKCPDGSTAVPGLGGSTRCIPGGSK